jgi:hypothetical protein
LGSLKDKLLQAGLVSATDAGRAEDNAEKEQANARAHQRATAEQDAATKHLASARRYPAAKPILLSDVRALFSPYRKRFEELERGAQIDGVLDPEIFILPSAQIIDGDLVLDELVLEAEGSNLLVRGDVTIKGILRQQFRAGGLVVFGRLSARHIVTTGKLMCFGDLDVPGTLYGNCTNYETDVLGRANVGTLISVKEHLFSFWGRSVVGGILDVQGATPNLDRYGFSETRQLRPDVLDLFDVETVVATLRAHDSLSTSGS